MVDVVGVEQNIQGRGQGVSPMNKPVSSPRSSGLQGLANTVRSTLSDLAATAKDRAMGDDIASATNSLNEVMLQGNPEITRQKRFELQSNLIKKYGASAATGIISTLKGVTSGTTTREIGDRTVVTDTDGNVIATTDDRRSAKTQQYAEVMGDLTENAPTYMPQLNNLLTIMEATEGEGVAKHAPDILAAQTEMTVPFRAVNAIAERMDASIHSVDQFADVQKRAATEIVNNGMMGLMTFDSHMIRNSLGKANIAFTPENAIEMARAYKVDYINHVNQAGLGDDVNIRALDMAMEQQIATLKSSFDASANGDVESRRRTLTTVQIQNALYSDLIVSDINATPGVREADMMAELGTRVAGATTYLGALDQAELSVGKFDKDADIVNFWKSFPKTVNMNAERVRSITSLGSLNEGQNLTTAHNATLSMLRDGDLINAKKMIALIDAGKNDVKSSFPSQTEYDNWLGGFNALKANVNGIKDAEKGQRDLLMSAELYLKASTGN